VTAEAQAGETARERVPVGETARERVPVGETAWERVPGGTARERVRVDEKARGVAPVDVPSKPSAQGKAAVPGALSVPRPRPSLWRSTAPPTVGFEAVSVFEAVPPDTPVGGQPPAPWEPEPPTGRTTEPPTEQTTEPPTEQTTEPPTRVTTEPPTQAVQTAIRTPAPDGTRADVTPVDVACGPAPVRKKVHRHRAALPAASAAVAALVAATTYVMLAGGAARTDPDLGRWGASPAATRPPAIEGAGNAGRPPGDPFGSAATHAQGLPERVRVPAIGLDSPLERLHLNAKGALMPPGRFDRAGWYADGTAPGDVGPAVIAGHVDSKAGPAVFHRLRELAGGDRIEVVRGGTVLRFTVTRIAWYPKNSFPTEEVYGPTPDRQLRLITCGGVFDRSLRSYRDNLVVYAAG
jgi:Sortase domain